MTTNLSPPAVALPATVLLITLDSCRYDTACRARLPNLEALCGQTTTGGLWTRTQTHGTYTLPAHVSMFSAGKFPRDPERRFPPYLRNAQQVPYLSPLWIPDTTQNAPDIFAPFRAHGYHLLGVGSVGWFNRYRATAQRVWAPYFDTLLYEDTFSPHHPSSLEHQLAAMQTHYDRTCCFLNIGATHFPYRRTDQPRIQDCTIEDQIAALEYVDQHLWHILDRFARPTLLYITGDHGECFGEEGLWGHGLTHPCVLDVPSLYLVLDREA